MNECLAREIAVFLRGLHKARFSGEQIFIGTRCVLKICCHSLLLMLSDAHLCLTASSAATKHSVALQLVVSGSDVERILVDPQTTAGSSDY